MTIKKIEAQKEIEMNKLNAKYDTAKKIRELLDEARKQYGPQDWDDEDIESQVLELVNEE